MCHKETLAIKCNFSPPLVHLCHQKVYISSDVAYILLMAGFSFSDGYLGTLALMFTPKTMERASHQEQIP